jgi:hypothetical protein
MALLICGLMALMAAPARAEEGHTYTSEAAFKALFYLIGGQYEIYVNAAHRPPRPGLARCSELAFLR